MSFFNLKTKQLVNTSLVEIPVVFLPTSDEYFALRRSVEVATTQKPELLCQIQLLPNLEHLLSYAWYTIWCLWASRQPAYPTVGTFIPNTNDTINYAQLGWLALIKAVYGQTLYGEHDNIDEISVEECCQTITNILGSQYLNVLNRAYLRGIEHYMDRVFSALSSSLDKLRYLNGNYSIDSTYITAIKVERVGETYLKVLSYTDIVDVNGALAYPSSIV